MYPVSEDEAEVEYTCEGLHAAFLGVDREARELARPGPATPERADLRAIQLFRVQAFAGIEVHRERAYGTVLVAGFQRHASYRVGRACFRNRHKIAAAAV